MRSARQGIHDRALVLAVLFLLASGCVPMTGPPGEDPSQGDRARSVSISPEGWNLLVGETHRFGASAQKIVSCDIDFCSYAQADVTFGWESSDPSVATVREGVVNGIAPGRTSITVTVEGQSLEAAAQVRVAENFVQLTNLTAAEDHTCGLGADGSAYCWGTISFPTVGEDLPFNYLPRRVPGGLVFTELSSGGDGFACGITTAREAYCWGGGFFAGAVDGAPQRWHSFASLTASMTLSINHRGDFACGLTGSGTAYCWGSNEFGQLGSMAAADTCFQGGVEWPCSRVPLAVEGDLVFTQLTAGRHHACGLTQNGRAYCWGSNDWGQLGDSSTVSVSAPVAVSGGLTFTALSAGVDYTCGLTNGRAYCWGRNDRGQLGRNFVATGSNPTGPFATPRPVAGGWTFVKLRAGGFTCGLTPDGIAMCWGDPEETELLFFQTREPFYPPIPTPAPGGLKFTTLAVGHRHACGLPTSGRAHCWSDNFSSPQPIPGPVP